MTDRNPAEILYPNQQSGSEPGAWRIELRRLPIFHRGHVFLALVDNDGRIVRELHGIGHSKHTGEPMAIAEDGADLKVVDYQRQADDGKKTDLGPRLKGTGPISTVSTVAAGSQQ